MVINDGNVSSLLSMEILFLGNRVTFLWNQTQISEKSEFSRKKTGVRKIPISRNSEIRRSLDKFDCVRCTSDIRMNISDEYIHRSEPIA